MFKYYFYFDMILVVRYMSKEELEVEILMQQTEILIKKVGQIVTSINLPTYKDKVPNIGITLNNKMVEIIQILRKYKIPINKSRLYRLITEYLFTLVSKAINYLEEYAKLMLNISPKISSEEAKNIIIQAKEILDNYQRIDDKIFDFDIAKDIQEALENSIEFYTRNGEIGGYDLYKYDPTTIPSYNAELATIGINKTLVNPNVDIKEIAFQQIEKIKMQFSTTPIIERALEDTIIDYLYKAKRKDMQAIQSIITFNASEELIDSIGRYLAYWAEANEFHNYNANEDVKKELASLGLNNAFAEIENNIKSNKYQQYIDWRNKIIMNAESR